MKKNYLILMLVITSGFLLNLEAINNPPIKALTEMHLALAKSGEQLFLKHGEECLTIIEKAANKIPMTGVAVIAFIPGDATSTWISKMRVVGKLADDKVNLLGIAYTKAAEMAVTLKNSGNPERKDMRGEYGYIGGVIKKVKGGYLVGSFSGGKGEDDVAAAKEGLDWLAAKFD
ncbi:MAG: hypothetical protein IPL46_10590 [Saprospiraceae bacterium]|nr:hypothetical protein [Saprospiraceae bacterium]